MCVAPRGWCLYPLCIPHRCNKILFTLKHEFWYVQEKFKVYMRNFICCMTTSSLSLGTHVPHNLPVSVTHQALNRRPRWVTAVSALIMQQIPGLIQSCKSQRKTYGGKSRKLVNMLYHKLVPLNCKQNSTRWPAQNKSLEYLQILLDCILTRPELYEWLALCDVVMFFKVLHCCFYYPYLFMSQENINHCCWGTFLWVRLQCFISSMQYHVQIMFKSEKLPSDC